MAVSTPLAEALSLTFRLLTLEVLHHAYIVYTYTSANVCLHLCLGKRLHKTENLLKKEGV